MTQLNREFSIIENPNGFSCVELTLSEYNSLDDYSIAVPIKREINDMGKIPGLEYPGERLVDIAIDENTKQILHCLLVEVTP